jgi:creatinine amidohydrolase/Fe(II)-dependent formamide hydrolase-like protein
MAPIPLGTDHLVAAKLSSIVGQRTGVPVLPTVPVGVSEHHRHFSGTLWVPSTVLGEYVKAIILSAASHGAKKVVIVNNIFAVHLMAFPPDLLNSPGHGDAAETSVNLYFHKNLVKMEQARTTKVEQYLGPLKLKSYRELGMTQFPWDAIDLTDTGTFESPGQIMELSRS